MYAENWNIFLGEVINHHVGNLPVYVHQPQGLSCAEDILELRVLVDEAFQKLS
jgi:hypothetical protein